MRLNLVQAFYCSRSLLLVDALGAASSAIATYFLLAKEHLQTGLPTVVLNCLAIAAAVFMLYDFAAFIRRTQHSTSLLIIACLNIAYSLVLIALLYKYRDAMTGLGLIYFCLEIVIILSLSIWEIKTAIQTAG